MRNTITAVFASEPDAVRASAGLQSEGFDESVLTISFDFTSDGIGAEAPGQAYENQGAQRRGGLRRFLKTVFTSELEEDTAEARRMADVQRGSVVLTVGPIPRADCRRAMATLKRHLPVVIRDC